jgi:hypothetical protein
LQNITPRIIHSIQEYLITVYDIGRNLWKGNTFG